jgi:hypothetical protein
MAAGEGDLERACLDLALQIKIVDEPISSDDARGLAERFTAIALDQVHEQLGIDRPLVSKAVHYLTQVHAIPPMGEDTRWFSEMLRAVLEIARPNAVVGDDNKEFLRDLREGIEQSLSYSDNTKG